KSSKGPASATSVAAKREEADRQTTIVRSSRFIMPKDVACIFGRMLVFRQRDSARAHSPQGTRFKANKARFTRHIIISLSACKKDFLTGDYSHSLRISFARQIFR